MTLNWLRLICPSIAFNGVETQVEGIIQLPMTMGQEPCEVTQMLNFLVIKVVTSYNAILGRTGINAFQAVASTYHMKIKFSAKNGIGMEKGDQILARSCYVAALRANRIEVGGGASSPQWKTWMSWEGEERRGNPAEELILCTFRSWGSKKGDLHWCLLYKVPWRKIWQGFCKKTTIYLSWTAADMPGIDPQLITHTLNVDPLRKPIKQKKRSFCSRKAGSNKARRNGETLGSWIHRGNTIPGMASKSSNG